MQDYQKRMIEEEVALSRKVEKLAAFLDKTHHTGISEEELTILGEQLKHMSAYRMVLRVRINAFKAELWDATQCHAELEFTSELDADAIKMCVRADRRECEHLNHANDSCNLSSMYECSMVGKIERPRIGGE